MWYFGGRSYKTVSDIPGYNGHFQEPEKRRWRKYLRDHGFSDKVEGGRMPPIDWVRRHKENMRKLAVPASRHYDRVYDWKENLEWYQSIYLLNDSKVTFLGVLFVLGHKLCRKGSLHLEPRCLAGRVDQLFPGQLCQNRSLTGGPAHLPSRQSHVRERPPPD